MVAGRERARGGTAAERALCPGCAERPIHKLPVNVGNMLFGLGIWFLGMGIVINQYGPPQSNWLGWVGICLYATGAYAIGRSIVR